VRLEGCLHERAGLVAGDEFADHAQHFDAVAGGDGGFECGEVSVEMLANRAVNTPRIPADKRRMQVHRRAELLVGAKQDLVDFFAGARGGEDDGHVAAAGGDHAAGEIGDEDRLAWFGDEEAGPKDGCHEQGGGFTQGEEPAARFGVGDGDGTTAGNLRGEERADAARGSDDIDEAQRSAAGAAGGQHDQLGNALGRAHDAGRRSGLVGGDEEHVARGMTLRRFGEDPCAEGVGGDSRDGIALHERHMLMRGSVDDDLRAVLREERIEKSGVADAAEDSGAPRAVSAPGHLGIDFEQVLFADIEEDDFRSAGCGDDAHDFRANETAGSGNEDARTGEAGNADGVGGGGASEKRFPVWRGKGVGGREGIGRHFAEIIIRAAMSLTLLPAAAQLRLLQQNQISGLELAEAHIAQIERLNPQLNAIVDFDPGRIREQARNRRAGRLSGLPVTIKSSIAVAGHRCETGSTLHRGLRPESNALAVQRLVDAGAVILGTTNCPEFLMAYETENLLHGSTRNPWNLEYSAGGSSGGESAAIAAGMSAGGLGSDSGGSVREPAHFTGICALKPTAGRVPAAGHLPACLGPFAFLGAIGPMARTVGDVALLFEVVSGQDAMDPSSAPVAYRAVAREEARQATIGVFEDDGLIPVTAETRAAVQAAAAALGRQGFTVKAFRPQALEEARKLWWTFFMQCGAMLYAPTIRGRETELSPTFRDFLEIAGAEAPLTGNSLLEAWVESDRVRARFLAEMREFPVLLCPACAVPAFRPFERSWTVEGRSVGYLDAMRYTQWWNLLGGPAAVVPVSRSVEGLPIGVQIAGRPYADELTLTVAAAVESEFGYQAPGMAR
jgi:Asp-tRNA(Asn)/Glu-tRNA(Gln) amidotransferase A subunit family amidase